MPAIDKRMLQAKADIDTNGHDVNDVLVEYNHDAGTHMKADGDVWDGRGHWWTDDEKERFLAWVATRNPDKSG